MGWLVLIVPAALLLMPASAVAIWLYERPARRRWQLIYHIEALERQLFPEWFARDPRAHYRDVCLGLPPEPWD